MIFKLGKKISKILQIAKKKKKHVFIYQVTRPFIDFVMKYPDKKKKS